jgi:hypothetical protein
VPTALGRFALTVRTTDSAEATISVEIIIQPPRRSIRSRPRIIGRPAVTMLATHNAGVAELVASTPKRYWPERFQQPHLIPGIFAPFKTAEVVESDQVSLIEKRN